MVRVKALSRGESDPAPERCCIMRGFGGARSPAEPQGCDGVGISGGMGVWGLTQVHRWMTRNDGTNTGSQMGAGRPDTYR